MAVQGSSVTGESAVKNPYESRESGSARQVPPGGAESSRRQPAQNPLGTPRSFAATLPGGVSRNEGGEALAAANSTASEILKDSVYGNTLEIRLFPVDHSSGGKLKISALVVAVRDKTNMDAGVAYHTMILAASIGSIQSKRLKIPLGNTFRDVEMIRTADNGNDLVMQAHCEDLIASAYPGSPTFAVPSTTIPATVNLKDKGQLNRVLVNGIIGCTQYLHESIGGNDAATLTELSKSMKFVSSLTFDHAPFVNDVQMPVRNDFCITLGTKPSQENNDSLDLNGDEAAADALNVRGYVDVAWTGSPDDEGYDRDDRNERRSTARYIPRIVCTSIYTGDTSYVTLIGIAIGMLNALRTNTAWMQALPMAVRSGDFNDYGILSLETPIDPAQPRLLEATPFRSDDEGKAAYNTFLKRMIMATPQICIDVPMCGPETWQLGFLLDIASGDADATAMFIEAMNQLTDGRFGEMLPADDWLVRLDSEVHLGTYRNTANELCDMREIGYVQMANAALPHGNGPNNPLTVWADSWADRDADIALRLDDRLRTQTAFFGAMNVTGMAQRLELSVGLLDTIAKSFSASAFHPVMTGFRSTMEGFNRARFSGHTMGQGNAGDMYRRNSYSEDRKGGTSSRYAGRGQRYSR